MPNNARVHRTHPPSQSPQSGLRLPSSIVLIALVVSAGAIAGCAGRPESVGASSTTAVAPGAVAPGSAPTTRAGENEVTELPESTPAVEPFLELVGEGFEQPIWVGSRPSDGVMLVAEQTGRIRELETSAVVLDLSSEVLVGNERGLLGVAFLEDRMFVNYTDGNGATVIAEYPDSNPTIDQGDIVVRIDQPASNHNGGGIEIGPEGMLWAGMGDGGRSGDVFRNGQNPTTSLGAMLRFDVSDPGVAVGAGGFPGGRDEVWAIGLRNPWRFTFDDDLLLIADVGQNSVEEISIVSSNDVGLNFGWPLLEGSECFDSCDTDGLVLPALEYGHDDGCSVTGGVVYRGTALPDLIGSYLYADYCGGWVRGARLGPNGSLDDDRELFVDVGRVTSFGRGADGEIFITEHGGSVFLIAGRAP